MGMVTNLMLLSILISGAAWFYGAAITGSYGVGNPYAPVFLNWFGGTNTSYSNSTPYAIAGLSNQITLLFSIAAGVMGLGVIIATALGFPNPFAIFVGIGIFLLNMFAAPSAVFNSLSSDPMWNTMGFVIMGAINLLWFLAILAWWRGGDTP